MWNLFKKSEEKKKRKEVYRIFLYCNLQCWDLFYDPFLKTNEKRQKFYKIYREFCQYIGDKYGHEYLDFFVEKMSERGWVIKK